VSVKLKVAILGSTGMLGSMVRLVLAEQGGYDLTCPTRDRLDAERVNDADLAHLIVGCDYVINCIGVIKPRIDEQDSESVQRAIQINAIFPHSLAEAAEATGCRVLQIATDCVFSGREGGYTESSPHDATDVYGKTKSLGEVRSPLVHHLRCSVIGPEPPRTKSRHHDPRPHQPLLGWFLSHPTGSTVQGYTNHLWNGVTTLAFAKICHGIMREGIELPLVQHVVPANIEIKYDLLRMFSYYYDRIDVKVDEIEAPVAVNRILDTRDADKNKEIWQAAGYFGPDTIHAMIKELVAYQ
jgi:dTDP-4-dehydrorhamnose reductase